MDQHFSVAVRSELMAFLDQFLSEVEVVVYLTVKDNLYAAVFVSDGLRSALNVYNTQPAVAQCGNTFAEVPAAVRTAMHHGVTHACD